MRTPTVHRALARIVLVAMILLGAPARADEPARADDQLIAFVLNNGTRTGEEFAETTVPKLRRLADRLGCAFTVIDVARGAPAEIHCVPAIVFADHRGRSYYQGRYTTLDRIRNFVLTARAVPQGPGMIRYADVPVYRLGRMAIAAPVKITPLSGDLPRGFDAAAFRAEATAAIVSGMREFELAARVDLARGDRTYHLDFHPHRSNDGRFYITTALYSEFHCLTPLHVRTERPWSGRWEDRRRVFAEAARDLESHLLQSIYEPDIGDGFWALDETTPVRSWDALGLPLPSPPSAAAAPPAPLRIPRAWTVDQSAHARRPAVDFRFPPPLDRNTGHAIEVHGQLAHGDDLTTLTGHFEVPTLSLTMGDPDLDRYIRSPDVLDVHDHPKAGFVIDSVRVERGAALRYGTIIPVRLDGRLTIKGRTTPVRVSAQLELIVGANAEPRLVLQATWSVHLLEAFGISAAPNGPAGIRHRLLYNCRIVMRPER